MKMRSKQRIKHGLFVPINVVMIVAVKLRFLESSKWDSSGGRQERSTLNCYSSDRNHRSSNDPKRRCSLGLSAGLEPQRSIASTSASKAEHPAQISR
jgi:hypothetical protein